MTIIEKFLKVRNQFLHAKQLMYEYELNVLIYEWKIKNKRKLYTKK